MVHLSIHLVNKVKLRGPVQCRWIFPIERDLCKLKSFVRNQSRLEGYLTDECLIFCSKYMYDGVRTRFNRYDKNCCLTASESSPIFPKIGHPIGGKRKEKASHSLWMIYL